MRHRILLVLCMGMPLFSSGILAQEVFDLDEQHRGVIYQGNYQIYPENRMGNGLYQDMQMVVTDPQQIVLEFDEFAENRTLVYLYKDVQGRLNLGLHDMSQDQKTSIKRVDNQFYEIRDSAIGQRKIFRIFDGKLYSVLGKVRTATSVTPSANLIAFYHITSSENLQLEDGSTKQVFNFRIHIVKRNELEVHSIYNLPIQDASPRIDLDWVNDKTLSYTLSNGERHEILLDQMLPGLF
ncbi:MAG: hypothetical protein HQM12_13870 [SAR324 cluster bacterium]|nr:hypothetical protein [SAR324 cluster bacterium]